MARGRLEIRRQAHLQADRCPPASWSACATARKSRWPHPGAREVLVNRDKRGRCITSIIPLPVWTVVMRDVARLSRLFQDRAASREPRGGNLRRDIPGESRGIEPHHGKLTSGDRGAGDQGGGRSDRPSLGRPGGIGWSVVVRGRRHRTRQDLWKTAGPAVSRPPQSSLPTAKPRRLGGHSTIPAWGSCRRTASWARTTK